MLKCVANRTEKQKPATLKVKQRSGQTGISPTRWVLEPVTFANFLVTGPKLGFAYSQGNFEELN